MADSENKELNEVIERFGAIREGNPELYDEIAKVVFAESVGWESNAPARDEFSYKAFVKEKLWRLRINNFPEEPMYTLFIEDKAIITFDDRPDSWFIMIDH